MKSIRDAITIVIVFQIFGLVQGISPLLLILIWLSSYAGSIITAGFRIAIEEVYKETLKEDKKKRLSKEKIK